MKKLTLFFAAASVATVLSAQQLELQPEATGSMQVLRNAKVAPARQMDVKVYSDNVLPAREKMAASTDTAFYLRPDGAFFGGWFGNGNNTYPRIIGPAFDSLTYVSTAATGNTWMVNGNTVGTEQVCSQVYGIGAYYLPTLTSAGGNTYMYGEGDYASKAYAQTAPAYAMPVTTCAMYTSTTINSNGNDCYMVGAGSSGSYAYGTNLTVLAGKTADTIGVLYDNIDVMYVDSIYLPIYNSTTTETMIPANATLKLTAYKVNLTTAGKYQITKTVLATATATAADITYTYTGTKSQIAVVSFAFKSTNALGLSSPAPVAFDGPFFLELTGYNEGKCNFGIYSDYYYPDGQTYFTVNGKLTGFWKGGGNIAMSLNTIFPALEPDSTNMVYTCPNTAGDDAYAVDESGNLPIIRTNFSPLANNALAPGWEISTTASWLQIAFDTTYFSEYDAIFPIFMAETLPDSLTGRTTTVTLSLYGKKLTYTIKQGDGGTGIKNTTLTTLSTVSTANGDFMLTYPATFSQVDVYNINGQQMGSYRLPATGSYSISTNDMPNGVYLLKMIGKTTEVLRAVK